MTNTTMMTHAVTSLQILRAHKHEPTGPYVIDVIITQKRSGGGHRLTMTLFSKEPLRIETDDTTTPRRPT